MTTLIIAIMASVISALVVDIRQKWVLRRPVQVIISGGAVQDVEKPNGVILEIRDYDVEEEDAIGDDRCRQDPSGDWYQLMRWESNTPR